MSLVRLTIRQDVIYKSLWSLKPKKDDRKKGNAIAYQAIEWWIQ